MVRDRCPGVLRLHEAADGLLARVRLPGGRLTAASLEVIAEVAGLGNGVVELTSRASLQVRGLAPGSADVAAGCLMAAGLLPSAEHERVRNILASPVAGRHRDSLTDTDEIVVELDRGICGDPALSQLPGRFLFAVLDGSHTLASHRADVSLEAERAGSKIVFALHLAGAPTTLTAAPADAAGLALRAARGFLELLAADGLDAWGLAAVEDGPRRLAHKLGGELAPNPASKSIAPELEPLPLGPLQQRDGRIALTVLAPLGRVDGAMLRGLAACSRRYQSDVRLSPRRTLSLIDIGASQSSSAESELGALGFVSTSGSGWSGLSACAGMGACAKALVDVRQAAEQRAALRHGNAASEHWSGCERCCGRPPDVPIAITAAAAGLSVEMSDEAHAVESVSAVLELLAGRVGAPA